MNGTDYTAKSVIGVRKNGSCYYDHKLSEIEKGTLTSNLTSLLSNEYKADAPLKQYDERLLQICQCLQKPFLTKNFEPKKEVVEQVRNGKTIYELSEEKPFTEFTAWKITDEIMATYIRNLKYDFNNNYWQNKDYGVFADIPDEITVTQEDINQYRKKNLQLKIDQMKREIENPNNQEGGQNYEPQAIEEAKEYLTRLENLYDEDIKKTVLWEKENRKRNKEVHHRVVDYYMDLREKKNTPQLGEEKVVNEKVTIELNSIRLPNLNEQLSEKLGLKKNSVFIIKKSATHIRPDRKGNYEQAFSVEEYKAIPLIMSSLLVCDHLLQLNTVYKKK